MKSRRITVISGALLTSFMILEGCSTVVTATASTTAKTINQNANQASTNSTTLNTPPQAILPDAFHTYQNVFSSVGSYLVHHSTVPVWMPSPIKMFNDPNNWMDVQFNTKNGYSLTVSSGAKLPANSPKIIGGNANILYDMIALGKNKPVHFYWDKTSAVIPHGQTQSINLGHGIKGTMYTGTLDGQEDRNIVWKENGWTFGLETQTMQTMSFTVGQAKQLVSEYAKLKLPIKSGKCIVSVGSGAPSQAEFVIGNTRYLIYTGGWRVMQVVSAMTHVS